jgi:hypothetical protein
MTEPALPREVVDPAPPLQAPDGITTEPTGTYQHAHGIREGEIAVGWPPPGRLAALRIALWGGVGAGLGVMAWYAIFLDEHGLLHWAVAEWVSFFLAIGVMLFWKLRIEPRLEAQLLGHGPAPHAHHAHGVKTTVTAALLAVVVVFSIEMVVELVHGPLRHQPEVFAFLVLLGGVVPAGGITYLWVRWTRGSLLRAAVAGFVGAFVITFVAVFVVTAARAGITKPQVWKALATMPVVRATVLNSLEWAFFGLVGAIVIHQKWGPRPSLGILVSVALVDLILDAALWGWWGQAFLAQDQQHLIPFMPFLRVNGWGLALFVCPQADQILDGSPVRRGRRGVMAFRAAVLATGLLLIALAIGTMRVEPSRSHQPGTVPAKPGQGRTHSG